MAKVSEEIAFQCLDLAMKQSTYKLETGLDTAARFIDFVATHSGGQPEAPKKRGRPAKTAGKTAGQGTDASVKAPQGTT